MQQFRVAAHREPGRSNGLSVADTAVFGLLVAGTAVWAAVTEPLRRPLMTLAALPLAIVFGVFGWMWTGRLLAGAAVAAATVPAFLAAAFLGMLAEGLLARRADRVWLLRSDAGRACGKVSVAADQSWTLTSVAAWPFRRGCGTVLTGRVCADADELGAPLVRLTADTAQVASWYKQFGFVRAGRNWLGQPHMQRDHPQMVGRSAEQQQGRERP